MGGQIWILSWILDAHSGAQIFDNVCVDESDRNVVEHEDRRIRCQMQLLSILLPVRLLESLNWHRWLRNWIDMADLACGWDNNDLCILIDSIHVDVIHDAFEQFIVV